MTEADAEALSLRPAWQAGTEFRLAFVEFERAVLAQHRPGAGAVEQAHPFGLGERHHADLRGKTRFVVLGGTGAPEAEQPGQEFRQVGWRKIGRASCRER